MAFQKGPNYDDLTQLALSWQWPYTGKSTASYFVGFVNALFSRDSSDSGESNFFFRRGLTLMMHTKTDVESSVRINGRYVYE